MIDRDRRPQVEIDALERDNIFCLGVAEVENLFCTREVLDIVSTRLARDVNADYSAVVKFVFKQLRSERETQVSLHVAAEIKHQLNYFNSNAKGQAALTSALAELTQSIDVASIYADVEGEFTSIIDAEDYAALLKRYNRKSLVSQVSTALGLKHGELPELVVRLSRANCADELRRAVKPYFGNFNQLMI